MADQGLFFFEETIRLLAAGLYDREQAEASDSIRFSGKLRIGISRLAVMASSYCDKQIYFHETMFITQYACKPVSKWFADWNAEFLQMIQQSEYYKLDKFIVLTDNNRFELTDECIELLGTLDNDLIYGEEQKNVYQMMTALSTEQYSAVREFLVTNPTCNDSIIREFKLKYPDIQTIGEILNFAYEKVHGQVYRCPKCGWTMTFNGLQASCCNRSCTQNPISEASFSTNDILTDGIYRLRRGIMRYIAIPGKLELQIRDSAEKLGYTTELYPDKDKYDVKICGLGRTIAVDAKTHHNPWLLKKQIEADFSFRNTGCSESYYVIPNEHEKAIKGFCSIAEGDSNIKCITIKQLIYILKGETD